MADMSSAEYMLRLQEEIGSAVMSNALKDARMVDLRFKPEDLGPNTSRAMCWYFDSSGKKHWPYDFGGREFGQWQSRP